MNAACFGDALEAGAQPLLLGGRFRAGRNSRIILRLREIVALTMTPSFNRVAAPQSARAERLVALHAWFARALGS
jgi:hypothetical protein